MVFCYYFSLTNKQNRAEVQKNETTFKTSSFKSKKLQINAQILKMVFRDFSL